MKLTQDISKQIEKAYVSYCMQGGEMPTRQEVATQLKLELELIDEYHNTLAESAIEAAAPFKVFFNAIVNKQVKKAMQGDVNAAKLVLALTHGFDGKAPEKAPVSKIEIEIVDATNS